MFVDQQKGFNVIAGGLFYPISAKKDGLMNSQYSTLFGISNDSTVFLVDGICFGEKKDADKLDKGKIEIWKNIFDSATETFLGRIKKVCERKV